MDCKQQTGNTLQRGPESEHEDHELVVQKLLEHQFDDWPNEAGVCALGRSNPFTWHKANCVSSLKD
jgi:hypothetical protein